MWDKTWLVRIWEEVGLTSEQASKAAEETWVRLLRRERPRGSDKKDRRSLTEFLVRDPLVSLNRIIGRGDAGLPFFDDDTKHLSLIAFGNVLSDTGIDPVVAMAYAKVVVEAYEPADLYGPVWQALGRQGPVDLEELRRMDWSPLRKDIPTAAAPDTVVMRAQTNTQTNAAAATLVTPAAPSNPTTAAPRPATNAAGGPATATNATIKRAPPPRPMRTRPTQTTPKGKK